MQHGLTSAKKGKKGKEKGERKRGRKEEREKKGCLAQQLVLASLFLSYEERGGGRRKEEMRKSPRNTYTRKGKKGKKKEKERHS